VAYVLFQPRAVRAVYRPYLVDADGTLIGYVFGVCHCVTAFHFGKYSVI